MSDETTRWEAVSRLQQMERGAETWDLSDNDRAAIRFVLGLLATAEVALAAMEQRALAAEAEVGRLLAAADEVFRAFPEPGSFEWWQAPRATDCRIAMQGLAAAVKSARAAPKGTDR